MCVLREVERKVKKHRYDQSIIFHKSKLLLLYYTISFLVIHVGSALIMFREAGLRELEMTTVGSDDGDILLLQRILSAAVLLLLISAWNSMDYWISSRKEECYVRILCGASNKAVACWLGKCYFSLIFTAGIISEAICMILSRIPFFLAEYLRHINWMVVEVSFVFLLASATMGILKYVYKKGKYQMLIRYTIFTVQMLAASILLLTMGSMIRRYVLFADHVNRVGDRFLKISYAEDTGGEWVEGSEEQYHELNSYIQSVTDGQCFSFYADSIVLQDVPNPDKYMKYQNENVKYFDALFITEKVPELYMWNCAEGKLPKEEDYSIRNAAYVPVWIGYDLGDVYSIGDIINESYIVTGVLDKDAFFLNPRWEGKCNDLRKTFVFPMECILREWGGAYLNQLNVIAADSEIQEKILSKVQKMNLGEIEFRSMESQLEYIHSDIEFQMRFLGSTVVLLLLLSLSSQICIMLFLVEYRRREYCIRMICGASFFRICLRIGSPLFLILSFSIALPAVLGGLIDGLWIAAPLILLGGVVIIAFPLMRLYHEPLIDSLKAV